MSDDIRIHGGGGQAQGGDQRRRRSEALARFKRGHKDGDLVQGVFLNLEAAAPGTAWVSLEGAALLAALPAELADLARRIAAGQGAGATPTGVTEADFPIKRGQSCFFVLESLEPEPVLRMLSASEPGDLAATAAEAHWRGVMRMPLTQLAARYAQQRSTLDKILQQNLWNHDDMGIPMPSALPPSLSDFSAAAFVNPEEDMESPRGRYSAFIKQDEARKVFNEMELYRTALMENLRPYGLLGFFFVPWLCPAASSLELAFLHQRSDEGAAPDRASAMQGISYKLRATFETHHTTVSIETFRRELVGILGGSQVPRVVSPDAPDLLTTLLALKPDEARAAFSRRA